MIVRLCIIVPKTIRKDTCLEIKYCVLQLLNKLGLCQRILKHLVIITYVNNVCYRPKDYNKILHLMGRKSNAKICILRGT